MGRERGRIFTAAECADLWRRYRAGESILGIARVLGRTDSSVYGVIQRRGGIAPAERHRSSRVLSLVEREEVSRGIAAGYTIRAIARTLSRAASTVCQEVSRHGGSELYRAAEADLRPDERVWLSCDFQVSSPCRRFKDYLQGDS
jgi:IS30 family transposase